MTDPGTPTSTSTDDLLARIATAAETTARDVATLRQTVVAGLAVLLVLAALWLVGFLVSL